MRTSIIAAVADNGVIGRDGELPWHLPADLARFKRLTMGHHLVVGRRTYESIGRPLPGRRTIVLSRQGADRLQLPPEVDVARSLEEALAMARDRGEEEAFIAGGAVVYAAALPRADRLYLTRVHAEPDGDVRFPELDDEAWETVRRQEHPADEANEHATTFVIRERRQQR